MLYEVTRGYVGLPQQNTPSPFCTSLTPAKHLSVICKPLFWGISCQLIWVSFQKWLPWYLSTTLSQSRKVVWPKSLIFFFFKCTLSWNCTIWNKCIEKLICWSPHERNLYDTVWIGKCWNMEQPPSLSTISPNKRQKTAPRNVCSRIRDVSCQRFSHIGKRECIQVLAYLQSITNISSQVPRIPAQEMFLT